MNSTTDLTIRLMFHRDLGDILIIERRKRDGGWRREDFRPVFHDNCTDGWVAEVAGHVVGHLVFRMDGPDIELLNIAVTPYWRRQGIAQGMLARLREKEPRRLLATVTESNLPVQLLLRQAGFRAVRILPGHFDTEDGYQMECSLAAPILEL